MTVMGILITGMIIVTMNVLMHLDVQLIAVIMTMMNTGSKMTI